MALHKADVTIKIQDLDRFTRLVAAIAGWASEASKRTDLTSAESELLAASIELADAASNGQEK